MRPRRAKSFIAAADGKCAGDTNRPEAKAKRAVSKNGGSPGKKINSPRKRRHEWDFRLCSSAGVCVSSHLRACGHLCTQLRGTPESPYFQPLQACGHLRPCRRLDAKRTTTVFHLFIHADVFAALRAHVNDAFSVYFARPP